MAPAMPRARPPSRRPRTMATEAPVGVADWQAWAAARRAELEDVLSSRLPALPADEDPGRLVETLRNSLLAPGKRLRPVLALAAAAAAGDFRDDGVLVAASTVELVLCYSLIHDDLP